MVREDAVMKTIGSYEKIADAFCKKWFDSHGLEKFADLFVQNLRGKKILDAGCGPGRDSKYFSEMGLDVTGIDAASRFVLLASRNAPKAKFIRMDMRHIDFPPETFDGVWANASLLHIPKSEAKATLAEIRNVIKAGGLLYASVKQGTGEKFVEAEEYPGHERFYAFYTKDEFRNLIDSCNFKILKTITHKIDNGKDIWIAVLATKK